MHVNSAEMPGSSHGRGGNTQQEQDFNFTDPTAEAMHILEKIMFSTQPSLADCEIIRLISQWDDDGQRELVATLRAKIIALKSRISRKEDDRWTMWLLLKTLQSKAKSLDRQLDKGTCTPPSSEDEAEDDEEDDESGFRPAAVDAEKNQFQKKCKSR